MKTIVRSEEFQRKTREAAEVTRKTGHESGFMIIRKKGEKILFGEVVEGTCDSVRTDEGFYRPDIGSPGNNWEFVREGDLHFHPEQDTMLFPTEDDLMRITNGKRQPIQNYLFIGQAANNHIGLLYIALRKKVYDDDLPNILDKVTDLHRSFSCEKEKEQAVRKNIKILRKAGFETCYYKL